MDERPEITDLIVDYDVETLERRPVKKAAVLQRFAEENDRQAQSIVRALPTDASGVLLPDAVDALLIQVHCEIQRLWEEFEHGARLLGVLAPTIRCLQQLGVPGPIRVVDVGCGLGYGIRWLADQAAFGDEVRWIGADYNRALVEEAQRLAELEALDCEFVVANAFELAEPAHILMSTGVIHHFRGEGLARFFAAQAAAEPWAFFHFDMEPTWLTPVGAWLFHKARMKLPISQHDGILSALRTHPSERLLDAARRGAPEYHTTLLDGDHSWLPLLDLFHAAVGLQAELKEPLLAELGAEASRLGSFE